MSITLKPTQTEIFRVSCMETELQALIQSSKLIYEHHMIISTFHFNPKKLFSYIKNISTQRSSIGTLIHISSPVIYRSYTHKYKFLINYFNFTFTRSTFALLPTSQLPAPSQLSFIAVTRSDIFDALCSLDIKKSPGCDKISAIVLVHCCTSLLNPIPHLFSSCLQSFSIPTEQKTQNNFNTKKGDSFDLSNYRPISLLCILSKMLEVIIYYKIFPFLQPLISHQQFDFVKECPTLNQLY